MTNPITNRDDVIDSRDVIARIEELSAEADDDDLTEELASLRNLAQQGETLDDWPHGVALIRDSYFETYARELAEDIGAIPSDASWPAHCIDWERAAEELQIDYTDLDFDGVTYWALA